MKTDYKKFIKSCVIVVLCLILIDTVFGFVANRLVSKMNVYSGDISKRKHVLDRMNEDIQIVGTSRATCHFVSSLLRDSINAYTDHNYSLYNGGINGGGFLGTIMSTESTIKQHNVGKLLILETSESFLYPDKDISNQIWRYSYLYKTNPIVKEYSDSFSLKTKIEMMSNLYRFNTHLGGIIKSDFSKAKPNDGYYPLYGIMKINHNKNNQIIHTTISPYLFSNFVRVLDLCKKERVNIVIVSPPSYGNDKDTYYEKQNVLGKLCKEKNIPYINMIDEEYFEQHPELFKDKIHLNDNGAKAFTKMFFERLKPYLDSMK